MADQNRNDSVNPEPEDEGADAAADASRLEHEELVDTGEGYEGPDVETSLTDSDLDFLSGQTTGDELAAERLADLQRITAEYANYRKRTEANRDVERERAVGETIRPLLAVLDDLDRAEKHGDLAEGSSFAAIASKLRTSIEKLGLKPVGKVGEVFDPTLHEAIFQTPSSEVQVATIADVVETGYFVGSTLLRPAKVVVSTPDNG